MPSWSATDDRHMRRALELAARGEGYVEPNPMVGCVIARGEEVLGEGYHQKLGGRHAEIEALRVAGGSARGATMYVTLEPCCHYGKTPPCTDAVIAAGIGRVIIAMQDPFPAVAGDGIRRLREAGMEYSVGLMEAEADRLNAPYLMRVTHGRPWVIAKWAMTLDGKIATPTGESRWISNETSRRLVHQLRGRMDAILVGRRTVEHDDPLLTARPAGQRTATRIVLDSLAATPVTSQLVRTANQAPVMVVTSTDAAAEHRHEFAARGCEVFVAPGESWPARLPALMAELGRRGMTNVLVEGGAKTLGGFHDAGYIDELHVFIAPRLLGGESAPSPLGGTGLDQLARAGRLIEPQIELLDGDAHVWGRVSRPDEYQNCQSPNQPATL